MKQFLKVDEWNIIEEGFHPDNMRASESIFSLGNGRFGQRGNFEETYSSDSLQGSYVAGITFLDRTRVGWWKNGYPRFFSRVPNAPDWSGIYLRLIDEELDLAHWDVEAYRRNLLPRLSGDLTQRPHAGSTRRAYQQPGKPKSLSDKVQCDVGELRR